MKKSISLTTEAHERVAERLRPGGIAVDATVGNGYDTLFLLQCVAPSGRVYGFDIQAAALESAKAKITDAVWRECLTLNRADHALMAETIPERHRGRIDAVMFNLGYLPGGDKTVTTRTGSTLGALSAAGRLLAPGGVLTIVAYPGHPGGAQETEQVAGWCATLEKNRFDVALIESGIGQAAPKLFVVNRIG